MGPVLPWASQAALAAEVRLPSTLSTTSATVTGSVLAGLVLVILKLYVTVLPSGTVAGAVLSTAMLGATLVTVTVALSVAVAGVFSSSRPRTVTVLITVPAFSAAVVVKLKVNDPPGARRMGPPWPWATHDA